MSTPRKPDVPLVKGVAPSTVRTTIGLGYILAAVAAWWLLYAVATPAIVALIPRLEHVHPLEALAAIVLAACAAQAMRIVWKIGSP